MRIGDRAVVIARIGKGTSPVPTGGIPSPRPPEPVPVGTVMAVDLNSDNPAALKVEALDPEHRDQPILQIPGEMFAEWRWSVKANEVGTWHLTLKVYVHLQGENVPVKEVKVPTEVPPEVAVTVDQDPWRALGGFWSSNWQYFGTTVVAALGLLAAFLGLRARQQASSAPGGASQGRRPSGRRPGTGKGHGGRKT